MAKRRKRRGRTALNDTAENIGAALGHVAARLDAWKRERAAIAADIQALMRLFQEIVGDASAAAGSRARAAFGQVRARRGGRPKGYKMSEATKRKLRAAWKRRKAAMAAKAAQS